MRSSLDGDLGTLIGAEVEHGKDAGLVCVSAGVGAAIFRNWPAWVFRRSERRRAANFEKSQTRPLAGEEVEDGKQFEGVKDARGLLVKQLKISRKGAKARR